MADIYTILGLSGFGLYVAAYALLQVGRMDGNGIPYTATNIAAAALVLASLTQRFNLASALIQITWIAIGAIGIGLRLRDRRARTGSVPARPVPVGNVADDNPRETVTARDTSLVATTPITP